MQETRLMRLLIGICLLMGVTPILAQSEEDLKGTWTNEQRTRKVAFYNAGDSWSGKLISADDDARLKAGHVLFENLVWNGRRFTGQAVTPRGSLSCSILFENKDKIKIQASKGIMSRSVYWVRVD